MIKVILNVGQFQIFDIHIYLDNNSFISIIFEV